MTDLLYTVKGQLLCNCCPLKAGDTVDIPITVEGVAGVPASIRAIVQLVEFVTVTECETDCEGRRYTLRYDETLLGPNLSELNVTQVGIPTCVDPVTLANEYTDQGVQEAKDYADTLVTPDADVLYSDDNGAGALRTVVEKSAPVTVAAAGSQSILSDVDAALTKVAVLASLTVDESTVLGYTIKAQVFAVESAEKNNSDGYGEFSLAGTYKQSGAGGKTLHTIISSLKDGDEIAISRVDNDLQVSFTNHGLTDKRLFAVFTYNFYDITP